MDQYLNFVFSRIANNEEIVRIFKEIENRLLAVLRPADLIKILLTELQTKFNIPYAFISFIENSAYVSMLPTHPKESLCQNQITFCSAKIFDTLQITGEKAILCNQNLWPILTAFSFENATEIKSVAIIPIHLNKEFIGTLNLGDVNDARFQPEFDTTQLEQLVYRFSLCLTNSLLFERMEYLAYHDELTSFLNQRGMHIELSHHILQQQKAKNDPLLALAIIDIQNLRSLNEQYGYIVVDSLIRHFSDRLHNLSRKSDILCRYNSDKFVWILPKTTSDRTSQLIGKLHKHLAETPFYYNSECLSLSVCVGVSHLQKEESPIELFDRANTELASQKRKRKAKILSFPAHKNSSL